MIQKIKNNTFLWSSTILFGGTMLANGINYLFHLAVGRLVSVEVYGEVESLTSLINIIAVPAMTLSFIATRYASHSKAINKPEESFLLFKYLNKKTLKYGLPLFVLALFLTPIINDFLKIENPWPLVLIWIMMFFSFFFSTNSGIIRGWQKFEDISWIGILGTIIKLLSAIIIIRLGFELGGAIAGFLLGTLASYIASIFALKFIFKVEKNKLEEKKDLIDFSSIKKYTLPVFIGTLALNILGNVDMFLAKHNLSLSFAGNYGALTIVSKIIFFATGVAATVLFSIAAEKDHKKENSLKTLKLAAATILVVSIFSTIFYALFPEFVLSMLFGEKYLAVAHYLVWFAVLASLYSVVNLLIQYLLSTQKTSPVYGMLIISILMTLGILFWGKNIYAILGVAIIAQVIAVIWGLLSLKKKHV